MNKHLVRFLLFSCASSVLIMGLLVTLPAAFAGYAQPLLVNQAFQANAVTTTHPIIKLSSTSGPPTTQLIVRGVGFGSRESIAITLDSTPIGNSETNRSGAFATRVTIPAYVSPGNFVVQATGHKSKRSAQANFLVQTNWSMFGNDARHSHFNPYENVLGSNNVVKLSGGWIYPTGSVIGTSPAVVHGVVYVGSNDGNVYAIDANTGSKLWSYSLGTGIVQTSPAVVNGIVYVGQYNDATSANLYALSATTGAKLWSFTAGGSIGSSPTVANDIVYFGSGDGNLYALNAKTGAKLWNTSIGGIDYSSSAVDNGIVYIGSGNGNVYALDAATGAKLWSYNTGFGLESSPAVDSGVVYIGGYDGTVYALNAKAGAKVWSYTTGNTIYSSPAVANGVVYIGSGDGNVYAFNAANGSQVWSYNTGSYIESSPAVANGLVYIGTQDDTLSILDASTGAKLWSATMGNPLALQGIGSSPAVADGRVYIGSRDGNLYSFCMCG